MKTKIKIALISALLSLGAKATVLTVNNMGGAQHGSLLSGFLAANNGDTLLVTGSLSSYSANDGLASGWYKNLVVIGTGYNSPRQVFYPTILSVATVYNGGNSLSISGNGSSKFYGITFSNEVNVSVNSANIIFDGCVFEKNFTTLVNNTSFAANNSIFKNCIFKNTTLPSFDSWGCGNIFFTHCIFYGALNAIILNSTFEHCVFLKDAGNLFGNLTNVIFNNCIFYGNAALAFMSGCVFNNCSSLNNTTGWSTSGNTANNCLNATNPLFVGVAVGSTYSFSLNFNLQAGSPATGAATDGTDLGLFGGSSHFSNSGEPTALPVVREMNIQNSSVPVNGNVNVKVRSTKAR